MVMVLFVFWLICLLMDGLSQFYDFFATRTTRGLPFGSGYYPYTEEPLENEAFLSNQPVPVFSCWNGLAIFNAGPFAEVRK